MIRNTSRIPVAEQIPNHRLVDEHYLQATAFPNHTSNSVVFRKMSAANKHECGCVERCDAAAISIDAVQLTSHIERCFSDNYRVLNSYSAAYKHGTRPQLSLTGNRITLYIGKNSRMVDTDFL